MIKINNLKIQILFENVFNINVILNKLPLKFIDLYLINKTDDILTFEKDDIKYFIKNNSNELYTILNDYELIDKAKVLLIELKEAINEYIKNKVISNIQEVNSEIETISPINFENLININYFEEYIDLFTNPNIEQLTLSTKGKIKEFKIKKITLMYFFDISRIRYPLFPSIRDRERMSPTLIRIIMKKINEHINDSSQKFFQNKSYLLYNIKINSDSLNDSYKIINNIFEKSKEYEIDKIKTDLNQYLISVNNELKELLQPLIETLPKSTQERILTRINLIE